MPPPPVNTAPTQKKASTTGSSNANKEKKKDRDKRISRRVNDREKERSASPQEIPIDPDEPTYCLCDQVRVSRDIKLVAKCKLNICFV